MISITGKYLGGKRVELTHGPSQARITTSAPKDNNGDGLLFSPTDLTAAALGSCMLTVISIVAERDGVDLSGAHFSVEKHISTDVPRRVVSLPVVLHLPKTISEPVRGKLERAAHTCPVRYSLHPDIKTDVKFYYDV